MNCLLITLLALIATVSAVPCGSDADCKSPLVCRDNRCVFSRPFVNSDVYHDGTDYVPVFYFVPPRQDAKLDKFPACPPCEAIGAVCKGGICVKDFASVPRDLYATPCPVPCEKFGQVCVRGVCQ